MQVERYVSFHPAAGQLKSLDRQIERLRGKSVPVALQALEVPEEVIIPAPVPPQEPVAPRLTPDLHRAREAVREEFLTRAQAEPDHAERAYRIELARLRRRFVEARLELPEAEAAGDDLAEVRARTLEMDRLERRIRELEERSDRRALYTSDELRKRRAERDEARHRLEVLREAELERLRRALEIPRRQPMRRVEIPAEELARAERERNEARSQEQMRLAREEREALEQLQHRTLPSPHVAPVPVALAPSAAPSAEGSQAAPQELPKPSQPLWGNAAALQALFLKRTSLYQAILRDLRVSANNAARSAAVDLKPKQTGVPDRTAELLPAVRRALAARIPPSTP